MEGVVKKVNSLAADDPAQRGNLLVIEVQVTRVHAHERSWPVTRVTTSTRIRGSSDHVFPETLLSGRSARAIAPCQHPRTPLSHT
jgi:hypothetical protein